MDDSFLYRVTAGETLIGDGAIGTQLLKYGLGGGRYPEEINLENPSLLRKIASEYIEAGADVLTTNTFGASPARLLRRSSALANMATEINTAAVACLKDFNAFISGSIGPCGDILEPYGSAAEVDLWVSFRVQAKALVHAGVDLICVETMMDLREAVLAVKAVRSISKQIPIIASMTFNLTPAGSFTIMGDSPVKVAESLVTAGANLVGTNCGDGTPVSIAAIQEFQLLSPVPLFIQPNAGRPFLDDDDVVYPESPEFMATALGRLTNISLIGGCCGTTPAHIKAISAVFHGRH